MVNWRYYFTGTILDRARRYQKRGLVQNVEKVGEEYHAEVIGSEVYEVRIWKKANNQLGMSCTCPYALEGKKCKHMAAVCMELEDDLNEKGLKPVAAKQPKKVDKQVQPFKPKNTEGSSEYTCFDLSVMTRNIKIMESQLEQAKKLIEQKLIALEHVGTGYGQNSYGDYSPMGEAIAVFKGAEKESYIKVRFTPDFIVDAECGVPGCANYYNPNYYYYAKKQLCKHELATLLLLADHIDTYNPGDTTDYDAFVMLKRYQKRYHAHAVESVAKTVEDLQLEPKIEKMGSTLELAFKTGTGRLYVVKDLQEFVHSVEKNGIQKFGKSTEIDYRVHKINAASQKYYDFLKRVVKEEELRAENSEFWEAECEIGSRIVLYGRRLDEFFDIMKDHSYTVAYQNKQYADRNTSLAALDKTPEIQLQIRGCYDKKKLLKGVKVSGSLPELIKGESDSYYVESPYLCRLDPEMTKVLEPLFALEEDGEVSFTVGRKSLPEFYYHTLPILSEYIDLKEPDKEKIEEALPPRAGFKFYLDMEEGVMTCVAKVVYGEIEISMMDHFAGNTAYPMLRDANAEDEALFHVMRYFSETDTERDFFFCEGEEAEYAVIEEGINELLTVGEVLCTDRLKRINLKKKPTMSVGVSLESGIMELEISSDEFSNEELLEILASYRRKKKYHRLSNGDFVNTEDENLEMLASMLDTLQISAKEFLKGKIKVPAYRALYLDKILEKNDSLYVERDRHFKTLIKEFKTMEDSDFELPESLSKTMRNYQTTGFKWLKTLDEYGFGGILADDMGLGKTLQVISVLLSAKEDKKCGTSLIISPASLIYNWQEEFKKFAPKINAVVVSGTQTERAGLIANYEKYDVLITSYDLLKRDIAEYEDKHFLYQILDEAQYIKNHTTVGAKAVKCIQSTTKYALTGTPIENRLSELWSIFDYLMPGFLYGYETFRKELELPIAKNKDEEASKRLKRMVSPFILRRLKQDVLKDLPEKLEEIQYAVFEGKQQQVYDGQVVHMREILAAQSGEEFAQSKIQILAELTKLREICCDPSLLFENYKGESAKRMACMDLVKSAMEGGHRMLIFSQFTSMLALLEEDLKKEGIAYYKITGATSKEERIRLVKQFNEGDVPVFLISLKAGGTGLNLVGADVVIHYDPWWNQAVQNQATDRAHRIGQKKVVTVYRLIAKNSIEEKIVKLQETKKNLADEILSGENGGLAQLSREELLALL